MLLTQILRTGAGISEATQPLFRLGCPRRLMAKVARWERQDGFMIRGGPPVRTMATVEPGAPASAAAVTPGPRFRGYRSAMAYGAVGVMGLVRHHRLHDAAQLFDSLNLCAPSLVPWVFGVPCQPNRTDLTVVEKMAAGCLFVSSLSTLAGLLGTRQTPLSDYVPVDEQIEWLDKLRRRGVLGLLTERLDLAATRAEEQRAHVHAVALLFIRLVIDLPIQAGLLLSATYIAALAATGALLGAVYCCGNQTWLAMEGRVAQLSGRPRRERISLAEADDQEDEVRRPVEDMDPRLRQLEPTIRHIWGDGAWARAVARARLRGRGPRVAVKNADQIFGHLFANKLLSDKGEKINRQYLWFGQRAHPFRLDEPDFLEQLDFFFHFAVARHAHQEVADEAVEHDVAALLERQARSRGQIKADAHAQRLERNDRENEQSTHLVGRDARTRASAANLLKRFSHVPVSTTLTEIVAFIDSGETSQAAFAQREHPSRISCAKAALATLGEMQKTRLGSDSPSEKFYSLGEDAVDMATVAASVWTSIGSLDEIPVGTRRERKEAFVFALADCLMEQETFYCAPGQAQRLLLVVDQQVPEVAIEQPDAPPPTPQFLTGAFFRAGQQLGAEPSDQAVKAAYDAIEAEARKLYTGRDLSDIRDGISSFLAVTYDLPWYARLD